MTGAGDQRQRRLRAPQPVELLRLATAGSVDDGKSTLIGRLLYDSKPILQDQLEQVAEATRRRRGDGTSTWRCSPTACAPSASRASRSTSPTATSRTPRRKFIIADTPGHVQYTRNMVTGASTADLSIILVDARNGVVEQSRRHAFICVAARRPAPRRRVNKMDLVDYDEDVFERIVRRVPRVRRASSRSTTSCSSRSARCTATTSSTAREEMPWYGGPPLLYHLEHVHIASDRNLIDARFPVQWVVRPMTDEHHDYRGYAGQVAGGVLRPGDEVIVLPSGKTRAHRRRSTPTTARSRRRSRRCR